MDTPKLKRQCLSIIFVLAPLLIGGCATLPENFDRQATFAYTDTQNTYFAKARLEEKEANPGKSGFLLLANGLDAFVARGVLARLAERSIDVQYYLFHDDLVGKLLTAQLLEAADRGVRIRMLIDDMDLKGKDLIVSAIDNHPNAEIRIFNPFDRKKGRARQFVTGMGSVTRRMHNKMFVVDNQRVILGGRNIGNEYFEADPGIAFADLDVLGMGPVVEKASSAFDLYWNSELVYPVSVLIDKPLIADVVEQKRQALNDFVAEQKDSAYLQALRNSDLANRIMEEQVRYLWGDAVVVYDQPEKILHDFDKTKYHLAPQLKPYAEELKKELIIFSPYFVPGKKGVAFLTQLSKRGVRVRILTNSLASNDVGIVHAGYSKYRKDLLLAGVELYELNKESTREQRKEKKGRNSSQKASLHAKSFVFDREQVFIGSLNLDPRSLVHNTEIGVVIKSRDIAEGMADWFDQNIARLAFRLTLETDESGYDEIVWYGWEGGEEVIYNTDPHTGFWKRFYIGFLRLLPIESQL